MDLNEAKKVMEISEEERASLDRYQGPFHAAINSLINLDPSGYEKLSKNWKLPETKEELENVMKDFINIDSAIYKYSKIHSNEMVKSTVYRGTGVSDVNRLKKGKQPYQFLSTSTSIEKAKSTHPVYREAAFVTVVVGDDVPRLNTSEFLNGKVDENEILISPFAVVKDKEEISKQGGFTYYVVELEKFKKEDIDIDKDELNKRKEDILNGFSNYRKNMKDAISIEDKIEQLTSMLSRGGYSIEDRKYISKDLEDARNKQMELYDNINNYQVSLKYLMEDSCYLNEKEIDEADKIVKDDLQVKEEENKRKESIQEYNDLISETKDRALDFDDILGREYDAVLSRDAVIKEKRIILGLDNKDDLSFDVGSQIADIFCSIDSINKKADEMYVDADNPENTVEALNSKKNKLLIQNSLYNKMEIGDFVKCANKYKDSRTVELKKDIYVKAKEYIRNAKIAQLDTQIEIKKGEKIGFFDRLFGKEKLKETELENLMLKKQLLENEEINYDQLQNFRVRDSLAELYKAMHLEVSANYSKDIGVFYNKLMKEFYPNRARIEAEVHQRVMEDVMNSNKNSNNSLELSNNVKKETTREKIARIKEENEIMHSNIFEQKNKPTRIRVFDSTSSKSSKRQMKLIVEGYNKLLKKSILLNEESQRREENFKDAMNGLRKPDKDELLNNRNDLDER